MAVTTTSNTAFLRAVVGEMAAGEHAWVCGFKEDPAAVEPVTRWRGRRQDGATTVAMDAHHNNYFSTAVLKGGARRRSAFVRVACLVADDVDHRKLLRAPSWVLRTSRNKVQAGFIIRADDTDAYDWDTVGRGLRAMHERGLVGADKSGNNAARYVRLPVGMNTKAAHGDPFALELIEWRPDCKFFMSEALEALGVDASVLDAPPPRDVSELVGKLPEGITETLADALRSLDPDMGRDKWLSVGMALHYESGGADEALDLWDEWSSAGSKYRDRGDLEVRWDSFGRYSGNPITGATLESMARSVVASDDDFDKVEAAPEAGTPAEDPAPKRGRFAPVPLGEFMSRPPLRWTIKRVIPETGVGMVYGPSGAGKSFLVIDLCMAVARGVPWRERITKQGGVAYIVAEGEGGFPNRLRAFSEFHGVDLAGLPFHVIPAAPNLMQAGDVKELVGELKRLEGLRMIVVDTLAQTTVGGDENSSLDMGKAIAHCNAIARATGTLVLLVGHTGKDESRGPRGSSSLGAAFDVAIQLEREGEYRSATTRKVKDGESDEEFPFHLRSVALGIDEDGEPITSCVALPGNAGGAERAISKEGLGVVQRIVVGELQNLTDLTGDAPTKDQLIAAVIPRLEQDTGKRDTRKQRATRAVADLVSSGTLVLEGLYVVEGAKK